MKKEVPVQAAQTLANALSFPPVKAIHLLAQVAVPFMVGGGREDKQGGSFTGKVKNAQTEGIRAHLTGTKS